MTPFAIVVDIRLEPGAHVEFRGLIEANARASVANEPGCQRFDVLEVEGEPGRVLLYEIYDDAAAFDAHCASAHFREFDAASAALVATKDVVRCALVCGG